METEKKISAKQSGNTGWIIFWIYLKCMAFAFTGALSAIPLLRHELVERYHFLTEDEYLEVVALSNSLPGIFGVYHSILAGHKIYGVFGAVMAVAGTVIPAFLSMLLVAAVFQNLPQSRIVNGAIRGIRAVSVAVIFDAGFRIFLKYKKNAFGLVLVLFATCVPLFTDITAFATILLAGLIGIISVVIQKQLKRDPNSGKSV